MANIDVTMVVDTAALAANPSDVAAACELYDSSLDPEGNTNFAVNAKAGDTVIFHIVAKDNQTAVSFSSFTYEGGTQGVFNPLPSDPSWVGTVSGSAGQSENYYINFQVPSIQTEDFQLDPKIKIKPS